MRAAVSVASTPIATATTNTARNGSASAAVAAPKTTPVTDSASAAPRESAIEIAAELNPRSRSVEASSIATLVRG